MQLDIFSVYEQEVREDKAAQRANALLCLLNEGRKKSEQYKPQYYAQHEDLIVLIAATKDKDAVGNIIDLDGNTPKDFCVNWRNLSIIKHELATYTPN